MKYRASITMNEQQRLHDLLTYERTLWSQDVKYVAGIDEAGRGPLAGPVVAAAVIFSEHTVIHGIDDSKKLSFKKRDYLYSKICEHASAIGIGMVDERIIDTINILQATFQAMQSAVAALAIQPQHILVDGHRNPLFTIPQTNIIGGDRRCFSIAAASIIAKVTRDRIMIDYDTIYPQYGFARHKGYGTAQHITAIKQYGRCPIHRKSFHVRSIE